MTPPQAHISVGRNEKDRTVRVRIWADHGGEAVVDLQPGDACRMGEQLMELGSGTPRRPKLWTPMSPA